MRAQDERDLDEAKIFGCICLVSAVMCILALIYLIAHGGPTG